MLTNQKISQDELDFSLNNVLFHNNEHLDFSMCSILSKDQNKDAHKANQNSCKQQDHQSHNKTKNTQGTTQSIQHRKSSTVTVKFSKNKHKQIAQTESKQQNNYRNDKKKKILIRTQSEAVVQGIQIECFAGKRQKKEGGFTKRRIGINKEESRQQYYFGTGATVAVQQKNNNLKSKNCQSRLNSVNRVRNLKSNSNHSKDSQKFNGIIKKNRFRQFSKSSQQSKRNRQSSSINKEFDRSESVKDTTNDRAYKKNKINLGYKIGHSSSCKKPRNSRKSECKPCDVINPTDLKKSQQNQIMGQYFGYQGSKNSLSLKSQLNRNNQQQNKMTVISVAKGINQTAVSPNQRTVCKKAVRKE